MDIKREVRVRCVGTDVGTDYNRLLWRNVPYCTELTPNFFDQDMTKRAKCVRFLWEPEWEQKTRLCAAFAPQPASSHPDHAAVSLTKRRFPTHVGQKSGIFMFGNPAQFPRRH